MKINEKNIAAFALSASPVDREGFLFKKGELNKSSQRRWFLLKGNLLFYFEKRGDKEPVGLIVLEGCTIELAEDEEHFGFKVVFHGPGNRSYTFGAESQESMEQWMKALACASYDYMKLMVAELQRQLDEMEESETLASSLGDSDNLRHMMDSSKEVHSNGSPLPPPRHRHNPFNTAVAGMQNDSANVPSTHRSHSTRSAPGRPQGGTRPVENVPRTKVSFRELHTSYGRRVLTDLNVWRHTKRVALEKKQATITQDLLITL